MTIRRILIAGIVVLAIIGACIYTLGGREEAAAAKEGTDIIRQLREEKAKIDTERKSLKKEKDEEVEKIKEELTAEFQSKMDEKVKEMSGKAVEKVQREEEAKLNLTHGELYGFVAPIQAGLVMGNSQTLSALFKNAPGGPLDIPDGVPASWDILANQWEEIAPQIQEAIARRLIKTDAVQFTLPGDGKETDGSPKKVYVRILTDRYNKKEVLSWYFRAERFGQVRFNANILTDSSLYGSRMGTCPVHKEGQWIVGTFENFVPVPDTSSGQTPKVANWNTSVPSQDDMLSDAELVPVEVSGLKAATGRDKKALEAVRKAKGK